MDRTTLWYIAAAWVSVAAVLGAVGFRVRGGWFGDLFGWPGQASRLFYGACMAACSGAALQAWGLLAPGYWVGLVALWFAGAVAFGTFGAIDAGRNEGSRLGDFFRNAGRGALYATPPALGLFGLALFSGGLPDPEAFALMPIFGLLQGPAYEFAWRRWPLADDPTEKAEFMTGAALGLGAGLAALLAL